MCNSTNFHGENWGGSHFRKMVEPCPRLFGYTGEVAQKCWCWLDREFSYMKRRIRPNKITGQTIKRGSEVYGLSL